jgi:prepilin-type N-terminal cleavage/methylation domain-containing protein
MTSRTSGTRRAFTLVEILLVLAILAITTLVSMPYLVKSIRGNRLRVATATVVKAGRYARNMALLHTQETKLVFDLSSSTISVAPHYEAAAPTPTEGVMDTPPADAGAGTLAGAAAEPPPAIASPSLTLSRHLDAVRIDYVEVEHKDREAAGAVTVVYRTNGRCNPYVVRLVDEYDNAMVVTVDALSSAEVEREDR